MAQAVGLAGLPSSLQGHHRNGLFTLSTRVAGPAAQQALWQAKASPCLGFGRSCDGGGVSSSSNSKPVRCRVATTSPTQRVAGDGASGDGHGPAAREQQLVKEDAAPGGEQFRWREQWYALGFTDDFQEGQPTRVHLFDEALVVLQRGGGRGFAVMADRCPHRAAALSQGLMTPDGNLQCAYHGWVFDGQSGECLDIPQIARHGGGEGVLTGRTCAVAYPAVVRQGVLFVWPVQGASPDHDTIPIVPELDLPGYVTDDFVRDLPVDYTVVLENLIDPDHGPFAHQLLAFDLYSASTDLPLAITTHADDAARFSVTAEVPALHKVFGVAQGKHGAVAPSASEAATSITRFQAPGHLQMCRREPSGVTKSMTAFYITPAGFGRSRFLIRYVRSFAPWLKLPRWLMAIAMNAFLDQDTNLIATQQEVTLAAEVNNHRAALAAAFASSASAAPSSSSSSPQAASGAMMTSSLSSSPLAASGAMMTRRQMYCHRSPTDNMMMAVGRWLDKNMPAMPNRYSRLASSGTDPVTPSLFEQPREKVLDRWTEHTLICPSSMRAYKAAGVVCAAAAGLAALCLKAVFVYSLMVQKKAVVAGGRGLGLGNVIAGVLAMAAFATVSWISRTVQAQFKYVHTRERQAKEYGRITSRVMAMVNRVPGPRPAGGAAV